MMNWKFFGIVSVVVLMAVPGFAVEPVVHLTFDDGTLVNSGTGGSPYDGQLLGTTSTPGGTPYGSISYVPGPSGQALDLTNYSQYSHGTFIGVDYTMPYQGTLAMWYYAGEYGFRDYESVFDGIEAVAEPGSTNTYDQNYWEGWIYERGLFRCRPGYYGKNFNYWTSVDADLGALGGGNNWYHLTLTWDAFSADKGLKLYVNGQLNSETYCFWETPPEIVCFGGGNTGNQVGTGTYDDIRIYDSVMSASEIAALVGVSPTVPLPTPVVHYSFEGNLNNSGSGGSALNGVHVDGPNGNLSYTTGVHGQGVTLGNMQDTLTGGDVVQVEYTLADKGAISVWYKPEASYNYNTLWDGVDDSEDWECWIYGDARLRARVNNDGSGDCSLDDLATLHAMETGESEGWEDQWYHITYTWSKEVGTASLYVNGKQAGTDIIGNWVDPSDLFFLGGGNDQNEYGVGIFDDLMIFEEHLTTAQAKALYEQALVPEPSTICLIVFGLISLAGMAWCKRG